MASAVPRRSTTRGDAGAADGHVGDALAPGPAEGVGDDDRHLAPGRGAAGRRGCAGPSGRGPRAAAPPSPRSTLDRSTPALAQTKPWRVSVITRSPRRRRTRTDSDSMMRSRSSGSSGSIAHEPALGLGHDLLGDDDDVAVGGGRRAAAMRAARSSPRPDLAQPRDREHGQAPGGCASRLRRRSPPAAPRRARRAARVEQRPTPARRRRSGGVHDRGGDDAADAAGLDGGGRARRRPRRPPGCRRSPRRARATPTTVGSWPSSASSRSAGPFSAAPATMGETATTSARGGRRARRRRPGTASSGPIETIGLDGHTTTTSALGDGARAPRGRARAPRPPRSGPTRRRRRGGGRRSTPGTRPRARRRSGQPGAHGVVGHRDEPDRHAEGRGELGGDLRQRGALARGAGCGRGGWRGRGRRGGTRSRRRAARGCP